jgi:hypothetical protein
MDIDKNKINVAIEELTILRDKYHQLIPVAKHQSDLEVYRFRKNSLDEVLFILDNIDILTNPKLEPAKGKGIDGFFKRLFLEVK